MGRRSFLRARSRRFAEHVRALAQLVAGFDTLVEHTAPLRSDPVVTHGEPHPGNLISVEDRLLLVDWDTVAFAAPERDLSLIVTTTDDIERYQRASDRDVHREVLTLYRLRWYLDDLGSAVRLFRHSHRDTPDTRRWAEAVAPQLEQLPTWLARVDAR